MTQKDFKSKLKEFKVSKVQIANYVRELKRKGHCYVTINGKQYLCIANN